MEYSTAETLQKIANTALLRTQILWTEYSLAEGNEGESEAKKHWK